RISYLSSLSSSRYGRYRVYESRPYSVCAVPPHYASVRARRVRGDGGSVVPQVGCNAIFTGGKMTAKTRGLLFCFDPETVDYSKSPMPGLTAAKVRAAVEGDKTKLEAIGYSVTSLYVDDGKTAEAVLTVEISKGGYDCIMVGAGLRIVPPYFLLFEKLINVI